MVARIVKRSGLLRSQPVEVDMRRIGTSVEGAMKVRWCRSTSSLYTAVGVSLRRAQIVVAQQLCAMWIGSPLETASVAKMRRESCGV